MNKLLPFRNLVILLMLFVTSVAVSQYEAVDARVKTYPTSFSDPQQLASRINSDFSNDRDKARAIFTWIASNVAYDMKEYFSTSGIAYSYTSEADRQQKEKAFRTSLARRTISTGKAICEGYSTLFVSLCRSVGLEAVIVTGTSRNRPDQIGLMPTASDHAWNAVRIDGKWELMDLAWAAGVVTANRKFERRFNDSYFATDAEKFANNHYPDDPKWLLTSKSAKEFAHAPLYHPAYIKSDVRFGIDTGYLNFKNEQPLVFRIENLQPGDRVYYITSKDNILDQLVADHQNRFAIFPEPKTTGYLTIFVNEKAYVSYKIVSGANRGANL